MGLGIRKESTEKVRQYEKMQEEFMNMTAHVLKTPIMSILGVLELLDMEHKIPTSHTVLITKENVDIISRNAKRLGRIAEDILEVTKIEGRMITLNLEVFILDDLIISVIDDIILNKYNALGIPFYDKKMIKIQCNSKVPIFLKADKKRISRVISNLLCNAIEFRQDNSTITLDTKISGNRVILTVKDSGRGIDPNILPRLFSKFTTISYRGIGLGLFISKNIIELHGGKISAKNNVNGCGATFAFCLPAAAEGK